MKNGKRLSALLLTLLLVFTALQLPAAAEEATAISAASPAIGADVGDTVDLSAYTYGGTALDEFTWDARQRRHAGRRPNLRPRKRRLCL